MQQQAGYPPEIMELFMTPTAFQAYVNWPEDTPNAYGGGEFYAGNEDENVAEDVGGNVNEEGMEQDDPTHVHSATSTRGDDDDGSDDMHGWEGRKKKDLKAHL